MILFEKYVEMGRISPHHDRICIETVRSCLPRHYLQGIPPSPCILFLEHQTNNPHKNNSHDFFFFDKILDDFSKMTFFKINEWDFFLSTLSFFLLEESIYSTYVKYTKERCLRDSIYRCFHTWKLDKKFGNFESFLIIHASIQKKNSIDSKKLAVFFEKLWEETPCTHRSFPEKGRVKNSTYRISLSKLQNDSKYICTAIHHRSITSKKKKNHTTWYRDLAFNYFPKDIDHLKFLIVARSYT